MDARNHVGRQRRVTAVQVRCQLPRRRIQLNARETAQPCQRHRADQIRRIEVGQTKTVARENRVSDPGVGDGAAGDVGVGNPGIGDFDAQNHVGRRRRRDGIAANAARNLAAGKRCDPSWVGVGAGGDNAIDRRGGSAADADARRACPQLRKGQRAEQVAGRVGHDCIRHRQNGLAREKCGERCRAVRAHPNFQPEVRPGEHTVAEVQRHPEQPVGDAGGGIGHRSGDGAAAAVGREKREGQVVAAVGGVRAAVEPPLVGKGRALREGGWDLKVESWECQQHQPAGDGSICFHGSLHFHIRGRIFCIQHFSLQSGRHEEGGRRQQNNGHEPGFQPPMAGNSPG